MPVSHTTWTQKWRRKTKQKIVDLLGGKCSRCGYNRYLGALDCHHLRDKKDTISEMLANPCKWEKIEEEIKKCILLCKNCHAEEHSVVV